MSNAKHTFVIVTMVNGKKMVREQKADSMLEALKLHETKHPYSNVIECKLKNI